MILGVVDTFGKFLKVESALDGWLKMEIAYPNWARTFLVPFYMRGDYIGHHMQYYVEYKQPPCPHVHNY